MNAGKLQNEIVSCTKHKTIPCSNKKKSSSMPHLPEEVIFSILVRLPLDILYNSMRYVCHKWKEIIHDPSFIKEHLLYCTSGLLIHQNVPPYKACFAELGKTNNATVRDVDFPFKQQALSTCDGLVLFRDAKNNTIHVVNPITRQRVTIALFTSCRGGFTFLLARTRSTGEYKVVCRYRFDPCKFYDCLIFTLGKDHEWKLIDSVQKLSYLHRDMLWIKPFSGDGFIYWAHHKYPFVLALDVESETIYDHPTPLVYDKEKFAVYYVPRQGSVSCLVHFWPQMLWDVWVLSDPRSGGWKMIFKIDLSVEWPRLSSMYSPPREDALLFTPLAWVNNGEAVIFVLHTSTGPYFAHNVKTRETVAFGHYEWLCITTSRFAYAYSLVSVTPS